MNLPLKEIQEKGNHVKDFYSWDTNEKGEEVSGDVQLEITLVPPPGQETKKVVEKVLTTEELFKLDKEEEEFDKDKENVRDIYDFGEELGRGAFAVVRYATHKKSKRKYAVKIIDKKNLGKKKKLYCKKKKKKKKIIQSKKKF